MQDIFESIFLQILNMSMTASYVIVAVLIVRLLLKKAPKKYSYALWAVALFRLACPVSFKSVISIFALKPFAIRMEDSVLGSQGSEIVHIQENISTMAQPEINTGIEVFNNVVNQSLPAATPMYSANPMQYWMFFGMLLWLVGIAALLTISAVSLIKLHRRLRTATVLEGNVWQSENVRSPFIVGLFRPRIYIPYGLNETQLGHVLTHERCHIRRLDHVVRSLAYLILCLHWFNPLVWITFYLMGRDMELSCDEKVLGKTADKAEYSETLLSFAAPRHFPTPTPLAFGESGVGQRIKNALKWRRPRLWVSVIALVLCLAAVAACAANPRTGNDIQDSPEVIGPALSADLEVNSLYELLTGLDINNTGYIGMSGAVVDFDMNFVGMGSGIIDALAHICPEEIKIGRGIPCQYSVSLSYGASEVITLGYGGDFVELRLSEGLSKQYPTERGVWEIHNAALTQLMGSVEVKPFAEFELSATEELEIYFDIPDVTWVDYDWQTEAFPVGNSLYSSSYSGNIFGENGVLLWTPNVERDGNDYPAERGEMFFNIWRDNEFIQARLNFRCTQSGDNIHCKAYAGGNVTARLDETTGQIIVSADGDFRPGIYEWISGLQEEDVEWVGISPVELQSALPDDINHKVAEAFSNVRASEISLGNGVIFENELAVLTTDGTMSLLYDGDKAMLDFDSELEKKYSGNVGCWVIDSPAIRSLFDSILPDEDDYNIINGNIMQLRSARVETGDESLKLSEKDVKELIALLAEGQRRVELFPSPVNAMQEGTYCTIILEYKDGTKDKITVGSDSGSFYRRTGTWGNSNDPGYVQVSSPKAREMLEGLLLAQ